MLRQGMGQAWGLLSLLEGLWQPMAEPCCGVLWVRYKAGLWGGWQRQGGVSQHPFGSPSCLKSQTHGGGVSSLVQGQASQARPCSAPSHQDSPQDRVGGDQARRQQPVRV